MAWYEWMILGLGIYLVVGVIIGFVVCQRSIAENIKLKSKDALKGDLIGVIVISVGWLYLLGVIFMLSLNYEVVSMSHDQYDIYGDEINLN